MTTLDIGNLFISYLTTTNFTAFIQGYHFNRQHKATGITHTHKRERDLLLRRHWKKLDYPSSAGSSFSSHLNIGFGGSAGWNDALWPWFLSF